MEIQALLDSPDWDGPFFKRLASNDTGSAPGHQGGLVIPKELRRFFPGLLGRISTSTPTLDRRIWADLYDGNVFLERVNTRYQYQSWGGERSAESRLTDNLSSLRNLAAADDMLLIQRSLIDLDVYRLILVQRDARDFAILDELAGGRRRWGVLGADVPMAEEDYEEAQAEQTDRESNPFELFDAAAAVQVTKVARLARSVVFKQRIHELYRAKCCICGTGLRVPVGPYEIEAAHIVPRSLRGCDDARNGLALCRRHHWAFDKGLFGIDEHRKIHVPQAVSVIPENQPLLAYAGKPIEEAGDKALRAAAEALDWHLRNVAVK
jgi:putative restriction endonuclease